MKTGAYWFSFLTKKEQEEFKVNCESDFRFNYLMEEKLESFQRFISRAFSWKETLQGEKYWREISQRKTD